MISMLRLSSDDLTPNTGADAMDSGARPDAQVVKEKIKNRAWAVSDSSDTADLTTNLISERLDRWVDEASRGGRTLGYERERRRGDIAPLLERPGIKTWSQFTVPMSMREVEPGIRLIMDTETLDRGPEWKSPKIDDADGDTS